MLTRKQHELLRFIHERLRESGVPPSFDEMKDALDLKSKSGIHRLITALEERGFIRRLPNRARALEVIRLPETVGGAAGQKRFTPSIVEGRARRTKAKTAPPPADERQPRHLDSRSWDGSLRVRRFRRSRTAAIPSPSPTISSARASITRSKCAAIPWSRRASSTGDLVVIRRQDNANTGDIIVALIDEEEATLKRFRRRGSSIALEAANQAYETRVLGPDRVKIQGKLVSLVRRY